MGPAPARRPGPAPLLSASALGIERLALRTGDRSGAPGAMTVLRTGMGPQNAERAVSGALGTEPLRDAAVLATGFCAGLAPGMHPGDLVVAEETRDARGRTPCTGTALLIEELERALPGRTVHTGPLTGSDHVVRGPERGALLATGAIAVDMDARDAAQRGARRAPARCRRPGGRGRPAARTGPHRHGARWNISVPRSPCRASRVFRMAPFFFAPPEVSQMAMPLRQTVKVATYLFEQKLRKRDKFPLIVELEPLYACNLKCEGCGKIQHPAGVLKQRMPVAQAVGAVLESGAPMVSIAGGEPLMHPQIDEIVRQLVAKKKYVFLCTNAMLLRKKMDKFSPSPYFAFAVHIDGMRERHDESVAKEGVFDEAVEAVKEAKKRGFRVTTNSTFFNTDTPQTIIEVLNFLNDELQVDEMMLSPAYAYEKAPDQEHFLGVEQTRELFRKAFAGGNRRRWRLNHSPLFLDFLEGKADFPCTAWAIPNYSLFGWQRPCYLMSDGYVPTYRELIEDTDWNKYGRGKDPRCANCMAHCGYEPTAVLATMGSLKESLRAARETVSGNHG